MAKIGFLLLCHKDPAAIVRQARSLTASGDFVAIHFDAGARKADHAALVRAVRDMPNVHLVRRRTRCGWGDWSLVRATLTLLREGREAFPRATHFYLISGDCRPITSSRQARAILDRDPLDHIECQDFYTSGWIQTGLREERLIYRHPVNERRHPKLFYGLLDLQQRLGLARAVPADLDIRIGSQWFCLRRSTVEKVLAFCDRRRDVLRFFATTWIPDETFLQTLVAHLVPAGQIRGRAPTFLAFTDYGMPATFHDDHLAFLTAQDFLFARKVSPEAHVLKQALDDLWVSDGASDTTARNGREVARFLASRGRVGARSGPRVWEEGATVGADRTLVLIAAKNYAQGKALSSALRDQGIMPALDYVFDETSAALPPMGGTETALDKRHRHRRTFIRIAFDLLETDRLALCVDPARLDVITDLCGDRADIRTLLLDLPFDAGEVRGHGERIGMLTTFTAPETEARILDTITRDLEEERRRLRQADLPALTRIGPETSEQATAELLAQLFDCGAGQAQILARRLHHG
ncbi:MAG: DUF5928 domain-containing protein [Pseudomonadota bacterium]